jgi:hypothetical protein
MVPPPAIFALPEDLISKKVGIAHLDYPFDRTTKSSRKLRV